MERNTLGLRRGGGRPKGQPNKATVEAKEAAGKIVTDPTYAAKLLERARRGKLAPAVECMLHHYYWGKPKDIVKVEGGIEAFTLRILTNGDRSSTGEDADV